MTDAGDRAPAACDRLPERHAVLIVGAGLAAFSAALHLAEARIPARLLLAGAATGPGLDPSSPDPAWPDPAAPATTASAAAAISAAMPPVIMGWQVEALDVLATLGTLNAASWPAWIEVDGAAIRLAGPGPPAPWHGVRIARRAGGPLAAQTARRWIRLGGKRRARLMHAAPAATGRCPTVDAARSLRPLLAPVSTFDPERVDAARLAALMQVCWLTSRFGSRMCVPDPHAWTAAIAVLDRRLRALGGGVDMTCRVRRLRVDRDRIAGVETDHGPVPARRVILALDPAQSALLVEGADRAVIEPRLRRLREAPASSCTTVRFRAAGRPVRAPGPGAPRAVFTAEHHVIERPAEDVGDGGSGRATVVDVLLRSAPPDPVESAWRALRGIDAPCADAVSSVITVIERAQAPVLPDFDSPPAAVGTEVSGGLDGLHLATWFSDVPWAGTAEGEADAGRRAAARIAGAEGAAALGPEAPVPPGRLAMLLRREDLWPGAGA
ncbi:MAG: hypothetical protein KF817_14305 [Phycisphaeraceae bacterium]|nr:hypothetical protein [Phycisphaeraceae bacterium]